MPFNQVFRTVRGLDVGSESTQRQPRKAGTFNLECIILLLYLGEYQAPLSIKRKQSYNVDSKWQASIGTQTSLEERCPLQLTRERPARVTPKLQFAYLPDLKLLTDVGCCSSTPNFKVAKDHGLDYGGWKPQDKRPVRHHDSRDHHSQRQQKNTIPSAEYHLKSPPCRSQVRLRNWIQKTRSDGVDHRHFEPHSRDNATDEGIAVVETTARIRR